MRPAWSFDPLEFYLGNIVRPVALEKERWGAATRFSRARLGLARSGFFLRTGSEKQNIKD